MNSLPDLLRENARHNPDQQAIITSTTALDFQTFDRLSDGVSAAIAGLGIVKGDRIALYCINCAEFAIAYVGILKSGATVVPVNILLKPVEIEYLLNDSGAKGLIYHNSLAENARVLMVTFPELNLFVSIGGESKDSMGWDDFLNTKSPVPEPVINPALDLAAILYTSGTTGRPKGAMLSHSNLLANIQSICQALQWREREEVVLLVLPMFHAFAATVGMLTPLSSGCAFVPLAKFEPSLVARSIAESSATIFLGVPSMYNLLLRLKDEQIPLFRSLRYRTGNKVRLKLGQRCKGATRR